jgi:uncharacterized protein YbaA (DUF1428 family)
MTYVDGFLLCVPKKKLAAYRRMANSACKLWRSHGALEYRECVGDDIGAGAAFCLPFTKAAKPKRGELIVFSWIVYKSRAHRERVNAKVMKDPRMAKTMKLPMPFDCKRMHYGGFKVLVES